LIGGETITEVLPTMAAFEKRGIGSILDLAMEADIDDESIGATPEAATAQAFKIATLMKESIDIASKSSGTINTTFIHCFCCTLLIFFYSKK
jgi:hypothetical protein